MMGGKVRLNPWEALVLFSAVDEQYRRYKAGPLHPKVTPAERKAELGKFARLRQKLEKLLVTPIGLEKGGEQDEGTKGTGSGPSEG